MADVSLPYSTTLTGDVSLELGQVSNALSVDLTSVAGTHTFFYWHEGSQDWVSLASFTTTTHSTLLNVDGRSVKYITTGTATGSVVEIREIANVRNA